MQVRHNHYGSKGLQLNTCGQIPRNGLTWRPVRNSGGKIITLIFYIFIINGLYSVI